MKVYKKKVVVITGGSRGIGAGIAKKFLDKNYFVICIYNKDDKSFKELKKNSGSFSSNLFSKKIDLEKKNDYKKIFNTIYKKFKRIDVLINNAGYLNQMPFDKIDYKEWDKTININLTSVFFSSQAISAIYKRQKNGKIINVASIGGQTGGTRAPHYALSKAAVMSITKSFSKLLASYNVNVNCISPGVIKTKMINQFIYKIGINNILKEIPLKKFGEIEDVANLAYFLSTEESKYITDQVININGGQYLG